MSIYLMRNRVQHYAWGNADTIPQLIGVENPDRKPFAEYWMGAHPSASSEIAGGSGPERLTDVIAGEPERHIGAATVRQFGTQLPFLFKLISNAGVLSIQAHPDRAQARQGFERENRAGLPLDAVTRNYRDDNHKPELLCALEPYWVICGFRRTEEIVAEFDRSELAILSAEVGRLARTPNAASLRHFFERILRLDGDERQTLLQGGLAWSQRHGGGYTPDKWSHPRYYWVVELARQYPNDIGALAPLYMNCFALRPGQALFLSSGVLHAYLRGSGVELMANSDNVLRGGLTPKHIDRKELLRVVSFEDIAPEPLEPQPLNRHERIFHTPAQEFRLSRIVLRDESYSPTRHETAEIVLCTSGSARLISGEYDLTLHRGQSLFVSASVAAYALTGAAEIFRATVAPDATNGTA